MTTATTGGAAETCTRLYRIAGVPLAVTTEPGILECIDPGVVQGRDQVADFAVPRCLVVSLGLVCRAG